MAPVTPRPALSVCPPARCVPGPPALLPRLGPCPQRVLSAPVGPAACVPAGPACGAPGVSASVESPLKQFAAVTVAAPSLTYLGFAVRPPLAPFC